MSFRLTLSNLTYTCV